MRGLPGCDRQPAGRGQPGSCSSSASSLHAPLCTGVVSSHHSTAQHHSETFGQASCQLARLSLLGLWGVQGAVQSKGSWCTSAVASVVFSLIAVRCRDCSASGHQAASADICAYRRSDSMRSTIPSMQCVKRRQMETWPRRLYPGRGCSRVCVML